MNTEIETIACVIIALSTFFTLYKLFAFDNYHRQRAAYLEKKLTILNRHQDYLNESANRRLKIKDTEIYRLKETIAKLKYNNVYAKKNKK